MQTVVESDPHFCPVLPDWPKSGLPSTLAITCSQRTILGGRLVFTYKAYFLLLAALTGSAVSAQTTKRWTGATNLVNKNGQIVATNTWEVLQTGMTTTLNATFQNFSPCRLDADRWYLGVNGGLIEWAPQGLGITAYITVQPNQTIRYSSLPQTTSPITTVLYAGLEFFNRDFTPDSRLNPFPGSFYWHPVTNFEGEAYPCVQGFGAPAVPVSPPTTNRSTDGTIRFFKSPTEVLAKSVWKASLRDVPDAKDSRFTQHFVSGEAVVTNTSNCQLTLLNGKQPTGGLGVTGWYKDISGVGPSIGVNDTPDFILKPGQSLSVTKPEYLLVSSNWHWYNFLGFAPYFGGRRDVATGDFGDLESSYLKNCTGNLEAGASGRPAITAPPPGSTLSGSAVTFNWATVGNAAE